MLVPADTNGNEVAGNAMASNSNHGNNVSGAVGGADVSSELELLELDEDTITLVDEEEW